MIMSSDNLFDKKTGKNTKTLICNAFDSTPDVLNLFPSVNTDTSCPVLDLEPRLNLHMKKIRFLSEDS